MLLAVFLYGTYNFAQPDWLTDDQGKNVTIFGIGAEAVVGIGGILIGVVLMIIWRLIRPDYFKGLTLPRKSDDIVLVPEPVGADTVFGGVAARLPATVIAPDFSNLPDGQTPVNADTLEPVDEPADLPPADPDLPRKGSE